MRVRVTSTMEPVLPQLDEEHAWAVEYWAHVRSTAPPPGALVATTFGDWCGCECEPRLHAAAGRVGAMDIDACTKGGLDVALDGADVIYNLGADEFDIADGAFVIYQGSHGDRGAHRADVILPAAAYTEENAMFVNTEGRPQMALRAGFAPGDAKENWAILRALSGEIDAPLPYDSLAQLRNDLIKAHPHLAVLDEVAENDWAPLPVSQLKAGKLKNIIRNFYLTNPITRASSLMAELSSLSKQNGAKKVAAE